MPENWNTYKLQQVVDDIAMGPFGSNIKVDNFIDSGVPVIRGMNLNSGGFAKDKFVFISEEKANSLKRSLAYPDDLVFTHRGTLGQIGIIPQNEFPKYLVSQSQMRLTVNKNFLVPRFLYYFFRSPLGQRELLKNSSQVGVPAIANPTKSLKEVELTIPPIEEQRRIAEILSALDEKIELNLEMNRTLEKIAQATFKHWFVDFQFPGFDGELVDGLPKGWQTQKVKDFAEVTDFVANGSFAALKENVTLLNEEDYAIFVRTTDNNSDFAGKFKYVNKSSYDFLKKSSLFGKEVIISNVGDTGTVFRPPTWLNKPMTLGSNAILVKADELNHYLYFFFSSAQGQHLIDGIVSGSAQLKFNKTGFRSLEVIIPSNDILKMFNQIYDALYEKIVINKAEIQTLKQVREGLLPKLMSGKIRVAE